MSDRLTDEQVAQLADEDYAYSMGAIERHAEALASEVQLARLELTALRAEVAILTAERERLIDAINTPAPTRDTTEGKDG